jgi:tRNA pseudouridine32 synthase / 23S rRNA pseudouridine746 synthase
MAAGGFLNEGMTALSRINEQISQLTDEEQIESLKTLRKTHSTALQHKIFEQYHFLNKAGESKSLIDIFEAADYKNPPAGAGECAAPKLLQYAFSNNMEPIALAEFWWGLSPKSAAWKHGHFYAPCQEKCAPILAHMLS